MASKKKSAPTADIKTMRVWGMSYFTHRQLLQPEGVHTCGECQHHRQKPGQNFLECRKAVNTDAAWTMCPDAFPACSLYLSRFDRPT